VIVSASAFDAENDKSITTTVANDDDVKRQRPISE
jgi:hypothetical protein